MPAGSERTECGQRRSQRLDHHDRFSKMASPRREAVLFGRDSPSQATAPAARKIGSFPTVTHEGLCGRPNKLQCLASVRVAISEWQQSRFLPQDNWLFAPVTIRSDA